MERDLLKKRKIIAQIITEEETIEDVLGEITIPDEEWLDIHAVFYPTEEQFKKIICMNDEVKLICKPQDEFQFFDQLHSTKAFFMEYIPKTFMSDKILPALKYTLMDLREIASFSKDEAELKIKGHFEINEVGRLQCTKHLTCKPTGEVDVATKNVFSIQLNNMVKVSFDSIFYYDSEFRHNKKLATLTLKKDVGEFQNIDNFDTIEKSVQDLDDLLMLLSFAIRWRCVCTGYQAFGQNKYIRYYRHDIVIPEPVSGNLLPNYLIEPSDLRDFVSITYNKFRLFENKDILRRAIAPINHLENVGVEPSFLILFSCVESILLYYKKNVGLDTIYGKKEFKNKRDLIENCLKDIFSEYKPEQHDLMNEKIPELNRPSFKTLFEKFDCEYSILNENLWPLTDCEEGISLNKIRNKLIHGDTFKNYQLDSLVMATKHLQVIVERMILKILDWPFEKSRVSYAVINSSEYSQDELKHHMSILNK